MLSISGVETPGSTLSADVNIDADATPDSRENEDLGLLTQSGDKTGLDAGTGVRFGPGRRPGDNVGLL